MEKGNRGLRRQRRHYPLARHRRGIINKFPGLMRTMAINAELYLGSWSASTSPARSPSPIRYSHSNGHHRKRNRKFGTTSLCQKSRSPSPDQLLELHEIDRLREMGLLRESFSELLHSRIDLFYRRSPSST